MNPVERSDKLATVEEATRAPEARLDAKLAAQRRVILELERRVRVVEEAVRLAGSGVQDWAVPYEGPRVADQPTAMAEAVPGCLSPIQQSTY